MTTYPTITPAQVVPELEKHVLVDGFRLVLDLDRSRGCRLFDAATGRELLEIGRASCRERVLASV